MTSGEYSAELTDPKRRRLLEQATIAVGGLALAGAAVPFVRSLLPSERARAQGSPVEVEGNAIAPGALSTVEWRGKPVWILRRTEDMLARLDSVLDQLTDPDSRVASQQPAYAHNATRSVRRDLLVVEGVCTHLGCTPDLQARARLAAARLARRVLLSLPRIEIRPRCTRVQGIARSDKSRCAALRF